LPETVAKGVAKVFLYPVLVCKVGTRGIGKEKRKIREASELLNKY